MIRKIVGLAAFFSVLISASEVLAEAPKASKELLAGTWAGTLVLDEEKLRQDPAYKALPREQAELALNAVKDIATRVKANLTMNADGSTVAEFDGPNFPASEKKKSASYEVVATKDATITIGVTPEGKKKSQQIAFRFEDDKTMWLESGNIGFQLPKGVMLRFKKQ